jgi:hypothetical protein
MIAQLRRRPGVVPDMRPTLLVLALLLLAAPARADETVATLSAATPLRAYGDIVVWSAEAPHGYQLVMRRGTGPAVQIPIAPRKFARGFDIGSDARGAPLLTYTRCKRSCDIYTATLGGRERRIAAASAPRENEAEPAVSRGRLAWLRGNRVYTRRLSDPPRVRSRRLYELPGGSNRSLDELDISGRRVAFSASFLRDEERLEYRIRIVDARTGRVRKVRDIGTGEGGQYVFGLCFHAGLLGWAKSCNGDTSGCGSGAFRYRPGRRATDATGSVRQSLGFTLSGAHEAYVLYGRGGEEIEGSLECPCRLVHRTAVRWR